MIRFFKSLYLTNRPFYILGGFFVLFVLSFFFNEMYPFVLGLLGVFLGFCLLDLLVVFVPKHKLTAQRAVPEPLSNGEQNKITITITNPTQLLFDLEIIDEIPFQFQERNFLKKLQINRQSQKSLTYHLRPTFRGEYNFGNLIVYTSSRIGLVKKRFNFSANQVIKVYPSIVQFKQFDFKSIHNNLTHHGLKKVRKLGQASEFEQIRDYVIGDNIKNINWKATAKRDALMVNQYQEEKNQNIYLIIDKGRVMHMPFNGLTLLDYAINASLVMANIILTKSDKAGMFTFAKKVENIIVADNKKNQLPRFLENLYKIDTNTFESDFSRLFVDVKKHINSRSLLILFTNFETLESLQRQLPYLRAIAKQHMLLVVFFENTELNQFIHKEAESTQAIFDQVIAQKFSNEKRVIVNELRKHGIYALLTKPENLTLDTINQYLEIKAKGLI
ncbi:DUF58 domain-containing protein [Flavobacterium agricola]|uniref:DUF58 domain-containing protein n=1 Tax=Flavobacterium agricola TaxID=2870839 RepID=A0ABY6LVP3_9FLAO|nr:DUF58 domain-containing protein [Flavobacterium agricola]UYW00395.1 DUF58 domain-containing protein [Flavobacterium agricola]